MPVNKRSTDTAKGTRATSASSERARRTPARPAPEHTENPSPGISEEQIRRRAYEIYQRRGGTPGDPAADWLQAERELRDEHESSKKPTRRRRA